MTSDAPATLRGRGFRDERFLVVDQFPKKGFQSFVIRASESLNGRGAN
jgi:hypothetical protein